MLEASDSPQPNLHDWIKPDKPGGMEDCSSDIAARMSDLLDPHSVFGGDTDPFPSVILGIIYAVTSQPNPTEDVGGGYYIFKQISLLEDGSVYIIPNGIQTVCHEMNFNASIPVNYVTTFYPTLGHHGDDWAFVADSITIVDTITGITYFNIAVLELSGFTMSSPATGVVQVHSLLVDSTEPTVDPPTVDVNHITCDYETGISAGTAAANWAELYLFWNQATGQGIMDTGSQSFLGSKTFISKVFFADDIYIGVDANIDMGLSLVSVSGGVGNRYQGAITESTYNPATGDNYGVSIGLDTGTSGIGGLNPSVSFGGFAGTRPFIGPRGPVDIYITNESGGTDKGFTGNILPDPITHLGGMNFTGGLYIFGLPVLSTTLTVGSTPIMGGTNGNLLIQQAGVLSEIGVGNSLQNSGMNLDIAPMSGAGAPSGGLGVPGSIYFDVTNPSRPQFYWKT
jgi:hypothetical protein